jgi:hypothetical protein
MIYPINLDIKSAAHKLFDVLTGKTPQYYFIDIFNCENYEFKDALHI